MNQNINNQNQKYIQQQTTVILDSKMSTNSKIVMDNVQRQKVKQTQVQLLDWMKIKQSFLKKHIPIQQSLIKNLDNAGEISLLRLRQAISILRQERQIQQFTVQRLQKTLLSDEKRFPSTSIGKPSGKKQIQVQQACVIWSNNVDKVFNCLSNGNKKRILDTKQLIKIINKAEQQISKQQLRYNNELKKSVKIVEKVLQKIDMIEKQQQLIILNITKDSKNKQRDGNFYLTEYKKMEIQFKNQFIAITQRGTQIFNLMKTVLDNEKLLAKRLKQILQVYFKAKNTIYKQNQFDQRILGGLTVMQDNIAQQRKKYFNKYLLSQDQIEHIKIMVPQPNENGSVPNLQCIVRYLKLNLDDYLLKLDATNKLTFFSKNLSYRKWDQVALAQGWIITTFTKVLLYLTFDTNISIFTIQGDFIRKINLKHSKISKIDDKNVVYLEEVLHGFFTNSKEEYQLKFDKDDDLDQFVMFIQNKIQ